MTCFYKRHRCGGGPW